MKIISKKTITQKTLSEKNPDKTPKELIEESFDQSSLEWVSDEKVILKEQDDKKLHKLTLDAEKEGYNVTYEINRTITIGKDRPRNSFELIYDNQTRDMVLSIIDTMINSYKLQYLSAWEKDHSTKKEPFNKKMESLRKTKDRIKNLRIKDGISLNLKIEL
jgi:hypothetical protein